MVFCGHGIIFESIRKYMAVSIRFMSLCFRWVNSCGKCTLERNRIPESASSIFSISFTRKYLSRLVLIGSARYQASFTVEATMVLGVVFATYMILIQQAYKIHDTVTGTMILTETIQKLRCHEMEEQEWNAVIMQGEDKGNPRLWLGTYDIEIKEQMGRITGAAMAGEWKTDMQISRFQPGETMRRQEALKHLGEKWSHDGDGIQTGNEPKLHGDSS